VRGLCKQFKGHVYITARNEALGKAAVVELEKEGFKPHFHQLDITDEKSCERLAQFIKQQYGGIDVLVNNAAIAYGLEAKESYSEQAEVTLRTNYWGTVNVNTHLFPLLRSHSRVVHVSSTLGPWTLNKCNEELQKKLRSVKTLEELNQYMNSFVSLTKENKHIAAGWPNNEAEPGWMTGTYGVSKIGVTLMTPIQQANMDLDKSRTDVIINACCPGYVATDLNNFSGVKTVDEGADTPVYLALLPPNVTEPRGKFVKDRTVQNIEEMKSNISL